MISEFTFIERAVIEVYVYIWFLQRVWATDRFEHLEWRRLKNMDLKTIITLSILVTMPVQGAFDSIWTFLKYQEGLFPIIENNDGQSSNFTWIPKPYVLWSDTNYRIKNVTEYLLCISFALQTGTLFLMQLFWNHLADQWSGKSFMVSLEFKVYVAWSSLSMILFPLSRWLTRDVFPYTETIPQMLFAIELIIICLIGLRNQRKLFSLLQSIQQQELLKATSQETTLQINYFSEMNILLSGGTLSIGISFLIFSIDGLTKKHVVNNSRFVSDLIMIHCNLGSLLLWIIMILIIYPRYYMTGLFGSKLLSMRSLSRISWIPGSYSGKSSDQMSGGGGGSGLADVGRSSPGGDNTRYSTIGGDNTRYSTIGGDNTRYSTIGGDNTRYSTYISGNILSAKSHRNNWISDNRIPEYGQDSAGNFDHRMSSESARRSTDHFETFKHKTTNSTTSSNKTFVLDGSNSSPLRNSTLPTPSKLSPSLQKPLPSREQTPSPEMSSSLVDTSPNCRSSSPLSSVTILLPDDKSTSSMYPDNAQRSSTHLNIVDDDVSYKSCMDYYYDVGGQDDNEGSVDDNEKNGKERRYSFVGEYGSNDAERLPDGTFGQRSPTLRFQLTLPQRPQSHPKGHMTVKSWI